MNSPEEIRRTQTEQKIFEVLMFGGITAWVSLISIAVMLGLLLWRLW